MGYSGFTQYLCKNGHESSMDALSDMARPEDWNCPHCKAPLAWRNHVNTTNGSYDDNGKRCDGYVELKVKTPAQGCECSKCGNSHLKEPATYEIPTDRGHLVKP